MKKFDFIPNDVIYVERNFDLRARSLVKDMLNESSTESQRYVYLPEILRYIKPDATLDDERIVFDEIIAQSGVDVTDPGFLHVLEDGEILFQPLDFFSDTEVLALHSSSMSFLEESEVNPRCFKKVKRSENVEFKNLFCSIAAPQSECNLMSNEYYAEVEALTAKMREAVDRLRQLGMDYGAIFDLIKEKPKVSRLLVTERGHIILTDYKDVEISMKPMARALYILFLKHKEGIIFKDLPDYRGELLKIYRKVSRFSDDKALNMAVDAVTDPLSNTINVNCSRINHEFQRKFANDLSQHYIIQGKRGEERGVLLDRDLVDWQGKW